MTCEPLINVEAIRTSFLSYHLHPSGSSLDLFCSHWRLTGALLVANVAKNGVSDLYNDTYEP